MTDKVVKVQLVSGDLTSTDVVVKMLKIGGGILTTVITAWIIKKVIKD